MELAGLVVKDSDNKASTACDIFYKRKEVEDVWQAMDQLGGKKILELQGQPGIGKSCSVWRKVLELVARDDGRNMLWISLDSFCLPVSTVYFQGRHFAPISLHFGGDLFEAFLYQKEIALDTVVVDGMSELTEKIKD